MQKPLLLSILLIGILSSVHGQIKQTIKGNVIDSDSEMTLIGANVVVLSYDNAGSSTDLDGNFTIPSIPVGRHTIQVTYLGYSSVTIPNVVVTAGKETYMNIALEEQINKLNEVVISGKIDRDQSINEMATISAKTFSLEEVTRYSGGRNDVSRLASNFAGVSQADDSRNDIVIRGNSPTGVLWKLEGIPIPNPNHFSTLGSTGGPVSALNTNLLKNSDFITSAFPSEYGNALSGVFDVGFRSGNKDKFEFTAQLAAFSGFEFMVEGPLNKNKTSSFLISYRHAFTSVAGSLGLDIGTNAVPNYRDLSFKFDFGQSKFGKFSIFGIGGTSDIDFLAEETDEDDIFAEPDTDASATSRLGIIGVQHNLIVTSNSYIKTVFSASVSGNVFDVERYTDTTLTQSNIFSSFDDETTKLALSSYLNVKTNAQLTTRIGYTIERQHLSSLVNDRTGNPDLDGDGLPDWQVLRNVDDALMIFQPFVHAKYKFSDKLSINGGLHGQYLALNTDISIEPRIAINFKANPKNSFNIGYGLHSQVQPLPIFFFLLPDDSGTISTLNEDLKFSKANHFVAGYQYKPSSQWRIKTEAYYQYLFDIPVDVSPSTFSLLNAGADFGFPEVGQLVNDGTGRNYGLELTVEKFFSEGYYGLLTGSLFQSKYTASDNIERNTAFNNQYVLNFLLGKEWKISKKYSLTTDMKFTNAGGRFYTPVDLEASGQAMDEVLDESLAYTEQYDPYLRLDLKLGMRMNSSRGFSQIFALDFQNLTNRENIFANRYNRITNEVNRVNQSGFLPDIFWRIEF